LKTPYLLGIITVLLFGSFAVSGMIAQAGPSPYETIIVPGSLISVVGTSVMNCPASHPFIISGTYSEHVIPAGTGDIAPFRHQHNLIENINPITNTYTISLASVLYVLYDISPEALCANFNFPMGGMSMIGGELLDLDNMALFIGAIGVNPVITGLVAITMGGVAAQAIWFVNSRRVKKVE